MANEKILNTRIQLLGDFESEWTRVNPILKANEAAISWGKNDPDNGQFGAFIGIKYGDGVKTWSQLDYSDKGAKDEIAALQTTVTGLINDLEIEHTDDVAPEVPTAYTVDVIANLDVDKMSITEDRVTVATEAGVDAAIEEVNVFDPEGAVITKALGGIAANTDLTGQTTHQILKALLYPYEKPAVAYKNNSLTDAAGTFEKGTTKTITSTSFTVTKKSKPITYVALKNGNTELERKTTGVANGGTVTFSGLNISLNSSNVQLTCVVSDGDNTSSASTPAWTFVYPYYAGSCAAGTTIDEALVESLEKKIWTKAARSYSFTVDNGHMVFAYPKAHGVLASIKDPNNFETIGNYTRYEVEVTGLDGTKQPYYVYVSGATTVSNFAVAFSY